MSASDPRKSGPELGPEWLLYSTKAPEYVTVESSTTTVQYIRINRFYFIQLGKNLSQQIGKASSAIAEDGQTA